MESVSTPKGPRQKTICSLGDLTPKPPEQWLHIARRMPQLSPAMFDEPPGFDTDMVGPFGYCADVSRTFFCGPGRRPTRRQKQLYRLHPKRALIESELVERERELFNLDQTIFFYDLTSTSP